MTDDTSVGGIDRHEIDCQCGKTTVGETVAQAEENHLCHFLNDHDDLKPWEREAAQEQLKIVREKRSVDTGSDRND